MDEEEFLKIFKQIQPYFPALKDIPDSIIINDEEDPTRFERIILYKRGLSYGASIATRQKHLDELYNSLGKQKPGMFDEILDLFECDEFQLNLQSIITSNKSYFICDTNSRRESELVEQHSKYPMDYNLEEYKTIINSLPEGTVFVESAMGFTIDNETNLLISYEYFFYQRETESFPQISYNFILSSDGSFLELRSTQDDENGKTFWKSKLDEDTLEIPAEWKVIYSIINSIEAGIVNKTKTYYMAIVR